MIRLLFFLFCIVAFTACSDNYVNGVSPGNSAFGGGWFLIPLLFGALAAFLIYQGSTLAKKGKMWIEVLEKADGSFDVNPKVDPVPAAWYEHGLSIMGLAVAALVVGAVIARAISFN